MSTLRPPAGMQGPSLDVQVLQGLETYITTEKFLHTLEAASAEWIDLSDHHQQPHKGWTPPNSSELELQQVKQQQAPSPQPDQPSPPAAPQASTCEQPSRSGSFLSRWRRQSQAPSTPDQGTSNSAAAECSSEGAGGGSAAGSVSQPTSTSTADAALPAAVAAATSAFEMVEPQGPLTESLMQEPFVLVSAEDAIEGMAYYIALYLSRAPEARYMEPKQLQAALRRTFTAIRRSRYRVIWDWGRCLYRWGAVSYSALQLYEHPWLVRAVVAGVWASSKMAFGVLF